MPTGPLTLAPVALAVILLVAGLGKLRARSDAEATFIALRVPRPLRRRWIMAAHPWSELALAVALVAANGRSLIAVGAVATGVTAGYLALVVRALQADTVVRCDCFGPGGAPLTWLSVVRNVGYVLLALATAVLGAAGSGVLRAAVGFDAASWWWLLSAAVVAAVVGLTVATGRRATEPSPGQGAGTDPTAEAGDELDYVRQPTPAVPVVRAGGQTVTLRQLGRQRAQLLLFVSRRCGWCAEVAAAVPGWAEALPQLDVRLVRVRSAAPEAEDTTNDLYDEHLWAYDTLGITGVPAAVLLGMDDQLAGGPVTGRSAVEEFVTAVRDELTAAAAATEDAPGNTGN